MKIVITALFAAVVMIAGPWNTKACAESLFEKLSQATVPRLKEETGDMVKKIASAFDPDEIERNQAQIDFADYLSNFKNTIHFAAKLSQYAGYEKNLQFGRDNEMYRGIPERQGASAEERKEFVVEKYEQLNDNAKAEIATYDDSAGLCLTVCRLNAQNPFFTTNVVNEPVYQKQMKACFQSDPFRTYLKGQEALSRFRPDLVAGINAQAAMWKSSPPAPDSPIISPDVISRLSAPYCRIN